MQKQGVLVRMLNFFEFCFRFLPANDCKPFDSVAFGGDIFLDFFVWVDFSHFFSRGRQIFHHAQ